MKSFPCVIHEQFLYYQSNVDVFFILFFKIVNYGRRQ